MSRESEKKVRDMLRRDVKGPYILPPLEVFHVKHTNKEPSAADLLEAYLKALVDLKNNQS